MGPGNRLVLPFRFRISTMPARDLALLDRLNALYTCVVSDELDRVGLRNQVLRQDIRPLDPATRIAGYALTIQAIPVREVPREPYKLEFEAVDSVRPGDVLCVSEIEGSFWGELLTTAAQLRGCRGVVVDGYTRDSRAIMEMNFPAYVRGIHMADSLGRIDVFAYNVTVNCGGVDIHPSDLILADHDGVVVIPSDLAPQIIEAAEEKVRGENLVRDHLRQGMSVTEAWQRFGIL